MQRGTRTRMRSIHSLSMCVFLALAVQCETTHGVYEFRRGFCTLVLSLYLLPHTTHLEMFPAIEYRMNGLLFSAIGGCYCCDD